ncbi:putative membrane protein [Rickettsia amblyommatis str. Ac/Pa]|uniref:Putative membrane protein n=1 Tax=Rickettsia amblyommatis str. Ac/Pa TaxID=1359164 RepID=A0A0F3N7A4_RICAM|nr:putative membrane protein [Rickettsia amblyommatis str. Ac/Pa]
MSTTIVFLVKNFYNPILFSLIINWGCSCVILMLSHNKIIKDYK